MGVACTKAIPPNPGETTMDRAPSDNGANSEVATESLFLVFRAVITPGCVGSVACRRSLIDSFVLRAVSTTYNRFR